MEQQQTLCIHLGGGFAGLWRALAKGVACACSWSIGNDSRTGVANSYLGAEGDVGTCATGTSSEKHALKQERKEAQRIEYNIRKREKKREQRKNKQQARREALASMGEDARATFIAKEKAELRDRQEEEEASLRQAFQHGAPKVVINCSFFDVMDRKELTSLAKQLQLSYIAVRDLRSPIQLHITSIHKDNPGLQALDMIGFRKWLVHVHHESVFNIFPLERLVVLSPDAEEDLNEVKEDLIYVIGGLVDRKIIRNQTRDQAHACGAVCLRRLPVKSCGPPGMYPVLNVDTVVSILHERFQRGRNSDWRDILLHCMPQRQHPGPSRGMQRKQRREARKLSMNGTVDSLNNKSVEPLASASDEGASSNEDQCLSATEDKEEALATDGDTYHKSNDVVGNPNHSNLQQGAKVEVYGYGVATIISLGILPHGPHRGRYKVRYWDEKLYHILPEQIAKVLSE